MNPNTRLLVGGACCLFIFLGVLIIPFAGIQNDEALFADPLYQLTSKEFRVARWFHQDITGMVMTYIGTLKTLLYWPILAWMGASVWTVRLPMVLAGAATIFIFWRLANRSTDPRAASIALLLLATDPMFLITDTYDWGPVALEHLLLVTACFFLVRFAQESVSRTNRDLAWGFFFLGLALWNKAIFLWALGGLTVAGLMVFWREFRALFRWKRAVIAVFAFAFGALPFLIYNVKRPNATLKTSLVLTTEGLSGKFLQLRHALAGESLFGYLAGEDFLDQPKPLTTLRGRAAGWIRQHLGEHRINGMVYACGALLLAVPVWWRSRAARFSIVFCAVAWAAMALTRDAGGSAHHAVLLWPFPQLFVAATLAAIPWRVPWKAVAVAGTAVLVVMNLLVVNQYIYQLERNGADGSWSDAVLALSKGVPEVPGQITYVLDWGMQNSLALLHRGKLTLRNGGDAFSTETPSEHQQRLAASMLADRNALYVHHVPDREVFQGTGKRAEAAAQAAGLRKELLATYADTNGRPVFEVFRFVP